MSRAAASGTVQQQQKRRHAQVRARRRAGGADPVRHRRRRRHHRRRHVRLGDSVRSGTTLNDNGICVGSGGTGMADLPHAGAGQGLRLRRRSSTSRQHANTTTPIHVALYDPITFSRAARRSRAMTSPAAALRLPGLHGAEPRLIVIVTGTTTAGAHDRRPATGDQGRQRQQLHARRLRAAEGRRRRLGLRHRRRRRRTSRKFYNDPKPTPPTSLSPTRRIRSPA